MIRTFTALAIVAGLAMAPQPAHADRQTGCHKIKINGVEKEFCPGQQGAANATSRPVAPRGIQGGYGATGPIVVGASASMEITADQITVSVRFTENADDMSGVIQLLKDKREKIGKVAADANLKVTSTQITQLDVRQQRSSQSSGYNGSATFKVSIAGVSDPLDVVSGIEQEVQDVAVLDLVALALDPHLAGVLGGLLAAERPDEIVVGNGLGADEAALEIAVDDAGGLRCAGAHRDGPGAGFLRADGEVGLKLQERVARADHPVEARLLQAQARPGTSRAPRAPAARSPPRSWRRSPRARALRLAISATRALRALPVAASSSATLHT
jgi:hypothetical protein